MYDTRGSPQSGPGAVRLAGGIPPVIGIPLAAPRPGYPAPVANLKISTPSPSSASGQSSEPPMGRAPQALRITRPQVDMGAPRMPPPIYQTATPRPAVPSTPHPLQPPMTPITPVFVRPSKSPAPADDKFSETIIRGNSEDNLLPKRGERGDDFWRRFSMVAREEKKPSSWLTKTQSGSSRLSLWVWVIGIILLICAGIGIGLWYYISHTSTSHQVPTAVGGSADETAGPISPTGSAGSSSSPFVTPTFTLARRNSGMYPTPTSTLIHAPSEGAAQIYGSRHKRRHQLSEFWYS